MMNNEENIKKEIVTKIDAYFNKELTAYDLYNWAVEHPHFVEKIASPTENDLIIDYVLGIMVTLNEEPREYHTSDEDLKVGRDYLLGIKEFPNRSKQ